MPGQAEAPLLEESVNAIKMALACGPNSARNLDATSRLPAGTTATEWRVLKLLVDTGRVGMVVWPVDCLGHQGEAAHIHERPTVRSEALHEVTPCIIVVLICCCYCCCCCCVLHRGHDRLGKNLEDDEVSEGLRNPCHVVNLLVTMAPPRHLASNVRVEVSSIRAVQNHEVRWRNQMPGPRSSMHYRFLAVVIAHKTNRLECRRLFRKMTTSVTDLSRNRI
mmetsp:Transcript_40741/g.102331  ORF Transcript_40741/g.102331 Transcript_40741/m.102331 type:complete len:221 (-) Transcript_40741:163-825(-)